MNGHPRTDSNGKLLSHPDVELRTHVEQVLEAARSALDGHSSSMRSSWPLLEIVVRLHDLGKGSAAFQRYIRDPKGFREPRSEKAHASLSMLLGLRWIARKEGLGNKEHLPLFRKQDWIILVAQAVGGHHRGLGSGNDLDQWLLRDETIDAFDRQLEALPLTRLGEAVGLDLSSSLLDEEEPWFAAAEDLEEALEELENEAPCQLLNTRLSIQFIFSILLEADKTFLAVTNPRDHLTRPRRKLEPGLVDHYLEKLVGPVNAALPRMAPCSRVRSPAPPSGCDSVQSLSMNALRRRARNQVLESLATTGKKRFFSMTLPTGMGKTLNAATWALSLREAVAASGEPPPRIIVAMPFLSIIDQTESVWRQLLGDPGGEVLLPSHSVADRTYDHELDCSTAEFFVDTWRSEVVLTTFDQLFMALLDRRPRHQMRMHNLVDSLLILDEIQTLPCNIWDPVGAMLTNLASMGETRILAMSATLPPIFPGTHPLIPDFDDYFQHFQRYRLDLSGLGQESDIGDFAHRCAVRSEEWLERELRVLITLNTRASARLVRSNLAETVPEEHLEFLSGDVTPRDRLTAIRRIRAGEPCIVVSTQCVEAGVDIDMDLVLRDLAPLDSLVQIAGRCNRNATKSCQTVEIVYILDGKGKADCRKIYDPVHLQETWRLFQGRCQIEEREVRELCGDYFQALASKKETGAATTAKLANWEYAGLDVRAALRGRASDKLDLLVSEQDSPLLVKLEEALDERNRWERRRKLRKLAPEIRATSISIYPRPGLDPNTFAKPRRWFWILDPGFYNPRTGFQPPETQSHDGALEIF